MQAVKKLQLQNDVIVNKLDAVDLCNILRQTCLPEQIAVQIGFDHSVCLCFADAQNTVIHFTNFLLLSDESRGKSVLARLHVDDIQGIVRCQIDIILRVIVMSRCGLIEFPLPELREALIIIVQRQLFHVLIECEQQEVLKKIEADVEIMSDRMEALADEIERLNGSVAEAAANFEANRPEDLEEAKKQILSGENGVFDGVIETNDGKTVGKEGKTLDDKTITGGINWYFKTVEVVK